MTPLLLRVHADNIDTMVSNRARMIHRTAMTDADDSRSASSQHPAALFEALRPDLLRFACWLCRDRNLAEDVVQEALLRAWRSRDSLTDRAAVRAWLLTIVRREYARLYR